MNLNIATWLCALRAVMIPLHYVHLYKFGWLWFSMPETIRIKCDFFCWTDHTVIVQTNLLESSTAHIKDKFIQVISTLDLANAENVVKMGPLHSEITGRICKFFSHLYVPVWKFWNFIWVSSHMELPYRNQKMELYCSKYHQIFTQCMPIQCTFNLPIVIPTVGHGHMSSLALIQCGQWAGSWVTSANQHVQHRPLAVMDG